MAQGIKDPAFSLLWLGLLLRREFDPWPQKLPYAVGMAKQKKKKKNLYIQVIAVSSYSQIQEVMIKNNS